MFFVITSKQDKVNNADSAFIFLKILFISQNGQSGQFCWGLWIVRVVRIIMEVNSSLGNVVWCGVLQSGLVWYTKIARMNWFSYGTMSWLLWFQAFLKACQQAQNYNGEIGLRFFLHSSYFAPLTKMGKQKFWPIFGPPRSHFWKHSGAFDWLSLAPCIASFKSFPTKETISPQKNRTFLPKSARHVMRVLRAGE